MFAVDLWSPWTQSLGHHYHDPCGSKKNRLAEDRLALHERLKNTPITTLPKNIPFLQMETSNDPLVRWTSFIDIIDIMMKSFMLFTSSNSLIQLIKPGVKKKFNVHVATTRQQVENLTIYNPIISILNHICITGQSKNKQDNNFDKCS